MDSYLLKKDTLHDKYEFIKETDHKTSAIGDCVTYAAMWYLNGGRGRRKMSAEMEETSAVDKFFGRHGTGTNFRSQGRNRGINPQGSGQGAPIASFKREARRRT